MGKVGIVGVQFVPALVQVRLYLLEVLGGSGIANADFASWSVGIELVNGLD